jgi:PAS domain S-box-containing protein
VEGFLRRNNLIAGAVSEDWLLRLRDEAEAVLSGAVGTPISRLAFEDRMLLTPEERFKISDSIRDISKSLRLSRQELAEANRQLALLKEFSEDIIESIPLGVATFDDALKVKYWNRAMERMAGVDKGSALGAEVGVLLRCLDPDILAPEIKEGEFTCRRHAEPHLDLKGYLSRLKGGQRGYVLVFEDITEKKKIEEELLRASRHASIGRLAAGVSHEVGNPLASISSIVQELLSDDLAPPVKGSLDTINQNIDRIARIVRSLNDFARLHPREKVRSDLRGILEKTLDLVRFDRKFRTIDITTELGEVPPIKVDPDQVQQVFLNLMLNARDSMDNGGSLFISMRRADGNVEVLFRDTGRGMEPEVSEKVFEPFFTTKGPARGTGLGLSICYSIIKDHGGTIEVDSEKGKGTTFRIRLPIEA